MSDSKTFQTILFSKEEDYSRQDVSSKNVTILSSLGHHSHGSSNLKLKNIVDYNWESRHYPGQLIAVHKQKQFIAYSLKVPSSTDQCSLVGVVRIINQSNGKRGIIKGLRGEVHDLGFAHLDNDIVLACIDEFGNIVIHSIEENDDKLVTNSMLEFIESEKFEECLWHRVVWCPFVPDADDDYEDEAARLLITTHNQYVRMWRIDVDNSNKWASSGGVCVVNAGVVAAAVSPDGAAVAVATSDGLVYFYQIMNGIDTPKCIHKWQPDAGKTLSSLFFLDNCLNHNSDASFWKFALTGYDNNTVIKIWSCTTWTCIQTITFSSEMEQLLPIQDFTLKPTLDLSSNFLILTNSKSKCLYVLELDRENADTDTYCKAVTEIKLQFSILCFAFIDAGLRKVALSLKNIEEFDRNGFSHSDEENDQENLDANSELGCSNDWCLEVVVRGLIVQPRALQRAHLSYPIETHIAESPSPKDDTPPLYNSGIADLSDRLEEPALLQCSEQLNLLLLSQPPGSSLHTSAIDSQHSLNLMTPEAFSSDNAQPESREEHKISCTAIKTVEDVEKAVRLTSENSSPSREVQQILCPLRYSSPVSEASWPAISVPLLNEATIGCNDIAVPVTSDVNMKQIAATIREENQTIIKTNHDLQMAVERLTACAEDHARFDALEYKLQQLTDAMTELASLVAEQKRDCESQEANEAVAAAGAAAARAAGAGAARALEPLARALQQELAAKLTATDELLRENIEKLVMSKNVVEGISQSVSKGVTEALLRAMRDSWIESMSKTLLPAIQKSFVETFNQLNRIFAQGTKEYAKQAEEAARLALERGSTVGIATIQNALMEHTAALQRHESSLEAAIRASPAPRQLVTSLLEAGDPNAAFQRALSASDLPLVVSLCRAAEPVRAVPALKPPVLLSLVQQLGADLQTDTQLKKLWLEEAVKRLSREATAHAHAPAVLSELHTRLRSAAAAGHSDLGLLQFVVEGIVRSLPTN